MIFVRDRELMQSSDGGGGTAMDLVSCAHPGRMPAAAAHTSFDAFRAARRPDATTSLLALSLSLPTADVELQNNLTRTARLHQLALVSNRSFWRAPACASLSPLPRHSCVLHTRATPGGSAPDSHRQSVFRSVTPPPQPQGSARPYQGFLPGPVRQVPRDGRGGNQCLPQLQGDVRQVSEIRPAAPGVRELPRRRAQKSAVVEPPPLPHS